MNKKSIQNTAVSLLETTWVGVVMLLAPALLIPLLYMAVSRAGGPLAVSVPEDAYRMAALSLVSYIAITLVVLAVPLLRGTVQGSLKKYCGLERKLTLPMVSWAVSGWVLYIVVAALVMVLIAALPNIGVDIDQPQHIGLGDLHTVGEYVAVFLALVVIAPVFEEIIFRGYLFGQLRTRSGFWVSSLLVSLAFGVVHLQANVAIDVFVLSMIMCFLREKFDSIWPTIIMHSLKNGLAYTFLFILPLYGVKLIQ